MSTPYLFQVSAHSQTLISRLCLIVLEKKLFALTNIIVGNPLTMSLQQPYIELTVFWHFPRVLLTIFAAINIGENEREDLASGLFKFKKII